MGCKKCIWLCLILSLFVLAGCYNKPVRHLASDVSLVKAGKSNREDVLLLLGEPDAQQMVSEVMEEWVYYEEDPTTLQKTPLVGGLFDSEGFGMIRLLMEDDMVKAVKYSSYEAGEFKWAKTYSWQEEYTQ